jgi:hypothetical protein
VRGPPALSLFAIHDGEPGREIALHGCAKGRRDPWPIDRTTCPGLRSLQDDGPRTGSSDTGARQHRDDHVDHFVDHFHVRMTMGSRTPPDRPLDRTPRPQHRSGRRPADQLQRCGRCGCDHGDGAAPDRHPRSEPGRRSGRPAGPCRPDHDLPLHLLRRGDHVVDPQPDPEPDPCLRRRHLLDEHHVARGDRASSLVERDVRRVRGRPGERRPGLLDCARVHQRAGVDAGRAHPQAPRVRGRVCVGCPIRTERESRHVARAGVRRVLPGDRGGVRLLPACRVVDAMGLIR